MCINQYIEYNPVRVAPDYSLKEAIALLGNRGLDYILVAEQEICGILTKSDVLKALATGVDPQAAIETVMTQPVITISERECQDLEWVRSLFGQHQIGYLPILKEDRELIGVISDRSSGRSFSPTLPETKCAPTRNKWQQQARELKRFFYITPSMLCIASIDGYFKQINPAFSQILGFSTTELLAEPFINFVHPEDRAATIEEVEKLSQGQTTISFENRYRTRDGSYRWLLWTAQPYLAESLIYAAAQDITARKIAERDLRENEARWQLALRGANDGIWDWNVKTNEVFFSRRWKEMLGYSEAEVGNTLEEWSQRVYPDDLGWVTEVIQDHFAGKTPFYISEHRVLCKDGSYKWILDRGQALWDEAGNVVRMTGSHSDITQRKEAEEKLARSENLLRTIVESEPECVKLLDRQGKLLQMNPAGLAIIEADSLAEMVNQSVYPLVDTEHRQAFTDLTQAVFQGKSGKLEFKLTGLKGRSRWLETHATPLREGDRITALLAVTRDITERKQAEIQLQQERDFSQAILDTVGVLVTVLDRQGRVINFNHTCETVTGYSFQEVENRQVWFLVPPEEETAVKAVFERLLAGQLSNHYENTWIAKDGSHHLISWSNTALFDDRHRVEFIIATGIDVTEQRRVWNRLEQQYRQTKLLAEISRKIRMSIELEKILQAAVTEVQQLLACDRVLIVRVKPNNTALPISESVLPNLIPMLGYELADPLLVGTYLKQYRRGEVLAIADLATASISPRIQELLQQFQVRAKLVVPILAQNELKGLLVAHQCYSSRRWREGEIQLLKQLADQIGVAVSQAQLLNNLEELVIQRTDRLTAINQLLESEIAERKQTEITLRENQQKLEGILDNADEAIISIDERQQIQLFNHGAEQIFGYQAAEVIGKSLDILLPQALRQIHRRHVASFEQSASQSRSMAERNTKVRGLRKNGREFPAEASIAKLQTKAGIIFTVMLKDITERHQAQVKLEASQALLAKAENIAQIGSWEYDSATRKRTWSAELYNILGFDRHRPMPTCAEILAQIHPEDRLLVRETLRRGHIKGIPWQIDYRLLLPDGTLKFVESKGEPILDERGKVLKVLETIMDVSDRVRAEKSRQRSEEQLQLITDALPVLIAYIDAQQRYRYNNRTYETWYGKSRTSLQGVQLREAIGAANYQQILPYVETTLAGKAVTFETQFTSPQDKAYWIDATYIPDFALDGEVKGFFSMIVDITERKAVEQMKNEFVSIASHEMRTPLTAIHGVMKLLNAGRLGELTASGQKMADMALKNSDRLVRLVSDLLDLERMESAADKLEPQQSDSAELIQQVVDTLKSVAEERQIRLETAAPSIAVWADRDRILQTLSNLIDNAIKFSPPYSTVTITSQQRASDVLFTVGDRGRGIPLDKQETIFERFQQVDASDSRQKGGTGLGLSICRHIVEQHGGKIWVESVSGEGSDFFFSLPQK